MSLVILCDFDGTIVSIDTCVHILQKFANADWRKFDEQFEDGEITLEECLERQFSTVLASKSRILEETEKVALIRPGFEKLLDYCKTHSLRLVIVSAGLDFVIKHVLKQHGWNSSIQIYAPKAKCTTKGITFTFPKPFNATSVNFKDDLVKHCKKEGRRVVYVGDGSADYQAARDADLSIAIKGSRLAELLRKNGIPHIEIEDFQELSKVIDAFSLSG